VFILDFIILVLDSTAKLQSGILAGNFFSIGNFDECIGVTNIQTHLGPFSGKHCLAKLKWQNDTFLSTRKLIALVSEHSSFIFSAGLRGGSAGQLPGTPTCLDGALGI
jgi:hypothetical protein